jgi:2-methylcitrate dehydratase
MGVGDKAAVQPMDQTLEALAKFATGLRFAKLPDSIIDKASDVLVDEIGCLIGGRDCAAVRIADKVFGAGSAGRHAGTVVGRAGRYSPDLAAFMNTAMCRYLDYNDHLIAGHPGDMTGALFAAATLRPTSGADLITAIVVAYETHARLAAVIAKLQTIDSSYSVALGATAGLCNLLRLPADKARHALAMAASDGIQLRVVRAGALSDLKGVASAFNTQMAVFVTLLAEAGLTGPPKPFQGRHGAYELFSDETGHVELAKFDDWKMSQTCMKQWPVAYGIQSAIQAAIDLRSSVDAERVEEVVLYAAPYAWSESGGESDRWDPRTRESADHSLPYAFARALRTGSVDMDAFEESQYRDPEVLRFMQRVRVVPDWERGPRKSDVVGIRAELREFDGTAHVCVIDNPKGHYLNPLSKDEISTKARRLMYQALGDRTSAAIETAWQAKSLVSIDRLFEALCYEAPIQ